MNHTAQASSASDPVFKVLLLSNSAMAESLRSLLPAATQAICATGSEKKALEQTRRENPDLILLDLERPRFKPFYYLSELFSDRRKCEIVVITRKPDIEKTVKCMKLGVLDVICWPDQIAKFRQDLDQTFSRWQKQQSGLAFFSREHRLFDLDGIVAKSPQMQRVVAIVEKIRKRKWVTVLIRGETGTGKEVIARIIHYGSPQGPKSPFVEINCTAIPDNLLEAELFGYEKGAFTDARSRKKGLFELAEGGTLFLDEIGDMNLLLQSKLLKAIEEKRFRRLGGTEDIFVRTRIIAGTNANLDARIADGSFRRDLYYRLNVISIHLPPLQERGEDILLLARTFLKKYAKDYQIPLRQLSPRCEELLMQYDWPGNVRELQHAMERVVLLGEGPLIEIDELKAALGLQEEPKAKPQNAANGLRTIHIPRDGLSLKEGEKQIIAQILRLTRGNKSQAAKILGISRPRLNRKIEEYRLQDFKKAVGA